MRVPMLSQGIARSLEGLLAGRGHGLIAPVIRACDGFEVTREDNVARVKEHVNNRDVELRSAPNLLQVEVSTKCRLRCRMCATVIPGRKRTQRFIDLELIDKLKPVLPYVSACKLYGAGEPFMVPYIDTIIKKLSYYGTELNTATNGILIDRELAKLICASFSSLFVSIDGATKETYEMIRVGSDFSRVERSFGLLSEYRKSGFKLMFGFVIMNCNVHELPRMIEFAQRYGAQEVHANYLVPFKKLPWTHDQSPTLDPARTNRYLHETRVLGEEAGIRVVLPKPLPEAGRSATVDIEHVPFKSDLLGSNRVMGKCPVLYDRAEILINGSVKPCGHSAALPEAGTLYEKSFFEIWNSPQFQSLRASFNQGVLPPSCSGCNAIRAGNLPGVRVLFDDAPAL